MATFSPRRAAAVLIVLAVSLLGMTGRVAYLQTWGREKTLRSAERQQHQEEVLYARRGTIFDSTGTVMAGTVQNQDLFVDAKYLADYYTADDKNYDEYLHTVSELAKLAEIPEPELVKLLSENSDSRYLKVKENLDETTAGVMQADIHRLKLKGVGFTPSNQRYYPMGSLAAHLLGGSRSNGHGLDGLELKFDAVLAGHDGFKRTLKDAQRNPIAVDADDYRPAEHGRHLILTIDANIQLMAEQELASTCQEFHAQTGEVVVMDPRNGDVLALANYPTFNPQNLEDSTEDLRRNRVLVSPYEPGSTIKPFIAGPALAWHVTKLDEVFKTNGAHYITPYGRKISDVHNGYPQLAMWDVLVKSSNIGMSMLGERMGNEKIWRSLTKFGFGAKTGIELPAESPGKVNPLKDWNKYSTESCAQGYELMVTPLQLARAFCCYANGGRLVTPRVVKGFLDADGNTISEQKPTDFNLLPQAIDPVTAQQVRRVLCDVVVRGTATSARSKTWNIFGKTGTAHISEGPGKGYSDHLFNSSFLAGIPAESPRLVVAFIVHKPNAPTHYGGAVAAPGATRLMERCMAYLQVPTSPDLPLPPQNVASLLWQYQPNVYGNRTVSSRE